MGEKLLAQRALRVLREISGPLSQEGAATLGWALDQRDWLWPGRSWADSPPGLIARALGTETLDWETLPRLVERIDTDEPEPPLFTGLRTAATLLELDPFDIALMETVAAFERLPRLSALRFRLGSAGTDVPALIGRLAGAPPAEATVRIRRSEALALGLLWYGADTGMCGNELQLQ